MTSPDFSFLTPDMTTVVIAVVATAATLAGAFAAWAGVKRVLRSIAGL